MKKKALKCILLATLTINSPNSYALFGVGDVVLDPANLVQNLSTATTGVQQYYNEYKQLVEQIRHTALQAQYVKNQVTNMTQDPIRIAQRMRHDFEDLRSLLKNAGQDFGTIAKLSQQHREVYGKYANIKSVPSKEHYKDFSKSISIAYKQSEEAIELLKQAEISERNREIVGNAIESSENAPGMLGIQQANAKIMAAQFKTLDNIDRLMSKNLEMHATATASEQMERMQAIMFKCHFMNGKNSPKCSPSS